MCFFFIESKVFVNLTYLYSSEINNQGLIFFVGLAHLIIHKWNSGENIKTYISNNLNIQCHLRKFIHGRRILKLFIIQMLITPKVFGLEKRDCTFWKWQSFSFEMVYVTYAFAKHNRSCRLNQTFRKEKLIHFCL